MFSFSLSFASCFLSLWKEKQDFSFKRTGRTACISSPIKFHYSRKMRAKVTKQVLFQVFICNIKLCRLLQVKAESQNVFLYFLSLLRIFFFFFLSQETNKLYSADAVVSHSCTLNIKLDQQHFYNSTQPSKIMGWRSLLNPCAVCKLLKRELGVSVMQSQSSGL